MIGAISAVVVVGVLGACGGDADPGAIKSPRSSPPGKEAPAQSEACDEARGSGADGIAELAVAVVNGGSDETIVPCADPQAVATLRELTGSAPLSQPEPCRLLPHEDRTASFCWTYAATGQAVTFRIGSGADATLEAVSLGGGPYDDVVEDESSTTTALDQLPIDRVTVQYPADPAAAARVQKLADDIYAGDVSKLTSYCWTMAPDYIDDRYGTPQARGAVLDALAHQLEGAQTGVYAEGALAQVSFSWAELDSPYPCPEVTFPDLSDDAALSDDLSESRLAWEIHRLAGRLSGSPVSPHDIESDYPLYCGNDPGLFMSQEGIEREYPPTYTDTSAVDLVIPRLDGASLRIRRNDSLGLTLVLDAEQPAGPALVWYDVVGGSCLGDTWQ